MAARKKAPSRRPRAAKKTGAGPPGLEDEVGADRAKAKAGTGAPQLEIQGQKFTLDKSFFKDLLKSSFDATGELLEPHPDPASLKSREVWTLTDGEADGYGTCLEEIARQEGEAFAKNAPWIILAVGLGLSILSRTWLTWQMVKAKKAKAKPPDKPKPKLPDDAPGQ